MALAGYRFGLTAVGATVLSTVMLVFAATTLLRLGYMIRGARHPASAPAEVPARGLLPGYSVMVALYREASVVPALLDSLAALDYPAERLQVLLLVEEEDLETTQACQAHARPGWEVVVVPPGVPKTKPRALNAGLPLVTGEYFTIYDAEDRPEPDQLIKAVQEFRRSSETVASLQARLDFYNSHQNTLTKWFTCDYATHFGLYVTGMASCGHPVPLGGTSTHFRTSTIREVGGWDSWNVTEDCELGMRLAAAGYETHILASTTWEEAVPGVRSWIRQRSRWVKGYAQTALVMLRAPLRTGAAMGWRRYAAALGVVGGLPVILMTQIVSWAILIAYFVLRGSGVEVAQIEAFFPEPLLSLGMVSLLVGNFAVLLAQVAEIYREERYDLVGHALLLPAYWLLTSIGAWRGVVQLVSRPHFWEKTQHGVSVLPQPVPDALPPGQLVSPPAPAAPQPAALALPPALDAPPLVRLSPAAELEPVRATTLAGPATVASAAHALALAPNGAYSPDRHRRPRPRALLALLAAGAFLGAYAAETVGQTREDATAAGTPPERIGAGPAVTPEAPTLARPARVPDLRARRRTRRAIHVVARSPVSRRVHTRSPAPRPRAKRQASRPISSPSPSPPTFFSDK